MEAKTVDDGVRCVTAPSSGPFPLNQYIKSFWIFHLPYKQISVRERNFGGTAYCNNAAG